MQAHYFMSVSSTQKRASIVNNKLRYNHEQENTSEETSNHYPKEGAKFTGMPSLRMVTLANKRSSHIGW